MSATTSTSVRLATGESIDSPHEPGPRPASSTGPSADHAARIGPNAVIRLAQALRADCGDATATAVFERAQASDLLERLPTEMVDERRVARLYVALYEEVDLPTANSIAHRSGQLTADYLLANRIPGFAQTLLAWLPRRAAARLLLKAVSRNAWTFAGSGRFVARHGSPSVVEIFDNPLRMDGCIWHVAVFERLFRQLVSAQTKVRETDCLVDGAECCRFEIDWA